MESVGEFFKQIESCICSQARYVSDTNNKFQNLSNQIDRVQDSMKSDVIYQNTQTRQELTRQHDLLRQELLLHMTNQQKEMDKRYDRFEAKLDTLRN